MSLINLRTNLKDLKFGHDRANNGSSNEPYVVAKIPATNEPLQTGFTLPNLGIPNAGTGGPDFLLRGGYLILDKIADDEKRLFKFFTGTKGILFTVKQNLLSRVAVNTQASPSFLNEGIYTPISSLIEAAGVPFGLHVNKQGLNPFGGILGKDTYSDVINNKVKPENSNRLVLLSGAKIYNSISANPSSTKISPNETEILRYGGGPDSFLGIGKTHIYFADQRTGINSPTLITDPLFFYGWSSKPSTEYLTRAGEFKLLPDTFDQKLLRLIAASAQYELSNDKLVDNNLVSIIDPNAIFSETGKNNPLRETNPSFFYGTNPKILDEYLNQEGKYEPIPDIFSKNLLRFVSATFQYDLTSKKIADDSLSGVVSPNYKPTPSTGKNNPLFINNKNFFFGITHIPTDEYLDNKTVEYKPIPIDFGKNLKRLIKASNEYNLPNSKLIDNALSSIISPNSENTTINLQDPNNSNTITYSGKDIRDIPTSQTGSGESFYIGRGVLYGMSTPGDFRAKLRNQGYNLTQAPNYTEQNIESRVILGDPGNLRKDTSDYTKEASGDSYDILNAWSIYRNENVIDLPDLIPFRIEVLDNDNPSSKIFIHFRAFLNNISDTYNSNWADTKYIGRGENFYTYSGFDRSVSLSWTVAAQSKAEIMEMYKRLNYLASVCAPDYSSAGYMRGNIVKLTIGGYFYEQYGIIKGFTYEMNDDNDSWEIGINNNGESDDTVNPLPHIIRVKSFSFVPIHNFVPRKQQIGWDGNTPLYGPERYIALRSDDAVSSNYGDTYHNPPNENKKSEGSFPPPTPDPPVTVTPAQGVSTTYQTTTTTTFSATSPSTQQQTFGGFGGGSSGGGGAGGSF